MELQKALEKRASIRKYSNKKPKTELIIEAIESANLAPSPGNTQILKYIIIEDEETKEKIAQATRQEFVKQAPFIVIVCSDSTPVKRLYHEKADTYVKQHTGAAVENLLLKVTSLGLSACWVGAFSDETLRSALQIPDSDNINIEVIIPIGYSHTSDKAKQKRKYSLSGRVFFDQWGNKFQRPLEKLRRGDI